VAWLCIFVGGLASWLLVAPLVLAVALVRHWTVRRGGLGPRRGIKTAREKR
jgi:hypothetical protein